jgi:hypothetical protein
MDDIETRLSTLETKLGDALNEISRLTARVSELEGGSSAYESTPYSDASALESRVEQLERDPERE